MDVGAPSNFERIRALYDDDLDRMREDLAGAAFDDTAVVAEMGVYTANIDTSSTRTEPSRGSGFSSVSLRARVQQGCSWPPHTLPNSLRSWNQLSVSLCCCRRRLPRRCRGRAAAHGSSGLSALVDLVLADSSRDRVMTCPPVDHLPPRAGHSEARATRSLTGTSGISARSAATGTSGRPPTNGSKRPSKRSRRFQGTLAAGPDQLLAAFRAMDDMGALSYRVWYFALFSTTKISATTRSMPVANRYRSSSRASSRPAPGSIRSCSPSLSRPFAAGSTRERISNVPFRDRKPVPRTGARARQGRRTPAVVSGRFNSVPHDSYAALTTADMKFPSIR